MRHFGIAVAITVIAVTGLAETQKNKIELVAAKDNFGRSNLRNRNNGASPLLVVGSVPNIRSLVGFDLSSVTNGIVSADLRFCMQNTMPQPTTLVVAPMAYTTNNASWVEGLGNVGVVGQNARVGESCYAWRSFRDGPWEDAEGKPVQDLMAATLWRKPIARRSNLSWNEAAWIDVPVADVHWLEDVRKSDKPVATFGLWGTAGDGIYNLHSRESAYAPTLTLVVKEKEDEDVQGN